MSILDAGSAKPLEGGPSFSLGNRIYRTAWKLAWLLLARWTPPPLKPWRRLLLRAFGARMERGSDVRPSAHVWSPRNLVMREYAAVGEGAHIYSMDRIELGAYAVISQRAHVCAGTHDIDRPGFQLYARPVSIGAYAWIAAEAFVGPGVTVGEGAVIGARGVATRDLDAWTVYAGNPARALRARKRGITEGLGS